MDFATIAPILNGVGIKESDVTAIADPAAKVLPAVPEMTKDKAMAIMADFSNEMTPHVELGQKHGVSTSQVRRLHAEFEAVKAAEASEAEESE